MRQLIILAALAIPLASCNDTKKEARNLCIQLQADVSTYAKSTQKKAADELEGLPKNSQIATIVIDAGKLRQDIKALCKGYLDSKQP
jgi:hypothetical protein